ncbi:MAG TPA: cardiolipin synthase [Thermoanaerobaculia bacterium]|nr:cardiolipin synthase [Thermoanaerobaculia bacterium]
MKLRRTDHPHIWHHRGTTYVKLPVVAFAGLMLTVVGMTLTLWSVKRKPETYLQVKNRGDLHTLIPSIVGVTEGDLNQGNKVEVLQNGDGFFPLLLRDIATARETVHIESYIWWDGVMPHRIAELLAQKARQGVEVRLLVDASGGHKMGRDTEKFMSDAGVVVKRFHRLRFKNLGRLNNRDHRREVIIDGRIGYIGGYGIADEWTGHAQDKNHWRDTGLRVEGPIVNRLQGAFCENWIEASGEVPAGEKYFPKLAPAGTTAAHLAYASPSGMVSSVQLLYHLAIKAAHREIIIENPYLLPDQDAIEALYDAVRRGVSVKILVPATSSTDSPIVQHASHHHFGTMLKRGVRIFEYQPTLAHQKLIIVDGEWACVGTANFDQRSFQLNDEITMGVVDRNIAGQLIAAFHADLRQARERHFDEWRKRPLWHKLIDGLAYVAHGQL